jgi:hypothetical protein
MIPVSDDSYFDHTRHEDILINHRLTWLFAGQPFLLMAYATIVTAKRNTEAERFLAPEHYERALHVIPVVGAFLAIGVFLGILGAASSLLTHTKNRSGKTAGVSMRTTLLGLAPPTLLPWLFVWAWWRIGF